MSSSNGRAGPLEPIYAILYLDALYVKMRHEGRVENRAVYVAVGVGMDGFKDVLGLWAMDTEGSKAWLAWMTELRNRGVEDVLIVCVDGTEGLSGSHRDGISQSAGATLHRAHDP